MIKSYLSLIFLNLWVQKNDNLLAFFVGSGQRIMINTCLVMFPAKTDTQKFVLPF